jgi:hypothetical protein
MRGLLAAGVLLVVLAWPGSTGLRPLRLAAPASLGSKPVALVWRHDRATIGRLDETTLRVGRPRTASLGIVDSWAFAPDGAELVVASHAHGDPQSLDELTTLDLQSLRRRGGPVRLPGLARALLWRGEKVVALVDTCCPEANEIDLVDRPTGTIALRTPIGGSAATIARASDALVLLCVPGDRIGPARLVVAGAGGSVRSVALPDVSAGRVFPQDAGAGADPIGTQRLPGIAVDPVGARAYVVQPTGPAADVDLRTLDVSYHDLQVAKSPLARLAAWLEPTAAAKGMSGPVRTAQWLGGGLVAVTGEDEQFSVGPDGQGVLSDTPAGLAVLDTRDWDLATLEPGANAVKVANGMLLATGSTWSSTGDQVAAIGLVAYGADRSRRFRLFPGTQAWVDFVLDGRAYVDEGVPNVTRVAVVDLRTGRVVGKRSGQLPIPLLADGPDN